MYTSTKLLCREMTSLNATIQELTEAANEAQMALNYNPFEDCRNELVLNLTRARIRLIEACSRRKELESRLQVAEMMEALEKEILSGIVGLDDSNEVFA